MKLSAEQQATLLETARRSIETYLRGGKMADADVADPELAEPGAAFVTLTEKGELRGCIGYSEPLYPLHETVARCAVAAASRDTRFAPVTLDELAAVEISISALIATQYKVMCSRRPPKAWPWLTLGLVT